MPHSRQRRRTKIRYKSVLERDFHKLIGKKFEYEMDTFPYTRNSHYTPDWKLRDNVYIETKGSFSPSQRSNLVHFREQHPDIIVYLVFANGTNKISGSSKTTYNMWAEKEGFGYHDLQAVFDKTSRTYKFKNPTLPKEWFISARNKTSNKN